MKNMIKIVAALVVAFFNATNAKRSAPRLYKVLFPEKKQLGLKLEFMKGRNGLNVKLTAHALDSTTKKIAVPAVKSIAHDMPLFKNEVPISEEKRQQLLSLNPQFESMIDSVVGEVVGDFAALPAGAEVNADVMMGQLLSTGTVVISENGVALTYTYGLDDATQKEVLLTTAKWSALATATPLADITRWKEAVATATGEAPSVALCSRKTFNYIKANTAINAQLLATKKSTSDKSLKELIFDETGIVVEIYTEKYVNAAGNSTAIFPDEIFTLLPAGNVGYMMYGTTPEEADQMGGDGKRDIVQCGDCGGVSVYVRDIDDPVTKLCRASAIMLPSGEKLHKIFIATVHS